MGKLRLSEVPVVTTKVELGKWARNLDLNSPHLEQQQQYITQFVLNFLATKLIHFYSVEQTTYLYDQVTEKLKSLGITDFPTETKQLFNWLVKRLDILEQAGIRVTDLSPLHPGTFMASSLPACGLDINHILPEAGN